MDYKQLINTKLPIKRIAVIGGNHAISIGGVNKHFWIMKMKMKNILDMSLRG